MLVLSRKPGEEIIVDGRIRIMVTEIGNGRVKIGIEAPKDVHIARSELAPEPAGEPAYSAMFEAPRTITATRVATRNILTHPRPR